MRSTLTKWVGRKKMIGVTLGTGALAATAIAIFGLTATSALAGGTSASVSAKKLTVGVSFDKMDDPFRIGEKRYLDLYARKMGVKLTYDDAQQSAATQSSQIRSLIARHVAGIIEIPWDTHAVDADISEAKAAGIPLALMDQKPASTKGIFFYAGGNPCADGRTAGKFLVSKAAGGRHLNVLELLGSLNNENGLKRSACFESAVKKSPSIKIVAKVPTNWQTNKAFAGTQNAIQQHPDINAVYTPWTGGLPAIYAVLKSVHRLYPVGNPKHVITISINGDQIGCKYVGDNMDDLDIATPLNRMAQLVMAAIVKEVRDHVQPKTRVVELPGLPYTPEDFKRLKSKVWGCAT